VAELIMTESEAAVRRLVGTQAFLQGRQHLKHGDVVHVQWLHRDGRAFGQVKSGHTSHSAIATLITAADGTAKAVEGGCTCSTKNCAHAAAVLLAALSDADQMLPGLSVPAVSAAKAAQSGRWEHSLSALLPAEPLAIEPERADVALQFELSTQPRPRGTRRPRISLRPVVPGANGNWKRGNISWSNLGFFRSEGSTSSARRMRLLRELLGLFVYSGEFRTGADNLPELSAAPSRRIWDLLAEAAELGLPLVQAGKGSPAVTLMHKGLEPAMTVSRSSSGLSLSPQMTMDGEPIDMDCALFIGEPAHGIAWWQPADEAGAVDRNLRLAPLHGAVDDQFRSLLLKGPIAIPRRQEETFLREYYPRLRQRVAVTGTDDLPPAEPPMLVLRIDRLSGHRLAVTWVWTYTLGAARHTEPLWAPKQFTAARDAEAEADILRRVIPAAQAVPELFEASPLGRRLARTVELEPMATIRLINDVVPRLTTMPDVQVVLTVDDDSPDYREADEEPEIIVSGDRSADDRDWFDLAVTISVDGENVPFDQLFVALSHQQEYLILASGTYFSLDREEFRRLARLIAEARALQDHDSETLRLSRYQAGLWEELERIGVVTGQAADWQEAVRALKNAVELPDLAAPAGLEATFRQYQLAGFNWLAALYTCGLGGILADDMGLGKTLQTLALFCHVREQNLSSAPFLVVAPTSVVYNWAAEAERFAPGLKVAAVTETQARRAAVLSDFIAGADVVVTSYTLFRLEQADYQAIEWAGLVLDEAQFVKNHQSLSYACVKQLAAPFKLAITGTPMENNLMELWSLLSITAPGLFPSPAKFTDYYRTPIEKDHDQELLDQLRLRIRPLMLRRTKEQVASDLPDKQEQVIELELNPRHRKIYQTHLQRERQKVLGLLGDLAKNRFEIFRSLTLLRQASLDVALIDPKYAGIPSTKLDAMMELVQDVVGEGHRTLIFSQFTRFLSAARDRLTEAGIDQCYLDGSTTNRAAVLDEFKTGDAPVFLISLKAGGFGLNLTEADYCILLDPWWNPATEAQAVDRIHRIGQTKKVMVYRLVAKNTIEEKVMALKAGKSALFSSVMDGGGFESATLSVEDIRGLLN
jgi:superfamily II DNA or RNA helicase